MLPVTVMLPPDDPEITKGQLCPTGLNGNNKLGNSVRSPLCFLLYCNLCYRWINLYIVSLSLLTLLAQQCKPMNRVWHHSCSSTVTGSVGTCRWQAMDVRVAISFCHIYMSHRATKLLQILLSKVVVANCLTDKKDQFHFLWSYVYSILQAY